MSLLAYNKTVTPLVLAAGNPARTLPASTFVGVRGEPVNVTSETLGLSGAQYTALNAQVVANSVVFEWTADPEYATPGLTIGGPDPGPHAANHSPGSIDALATAAPVATGDTNATGSGVAYSKSDHVHALRAVSYTSATRPLATAVAVGVMIFNTDDKALNISDGVSWYDSMGNLT